MHICAYLCVCVCVCVCVQRVGVCLRGGEKEQGLHHD